MQPAGTPVTEADAAESEWSLAKQMTEQLQLAEKAAQEDVSDSASVTAGDDAGTAPAGIDVRRLPLPQVCVLSLTAFYFWVWFLFGLNRIRKERLTRCSCPRCSRWRTTH
jgi:hypothetical protein